MPPRFLAPALGLVLASLLVSCGSSRSDDPQPTTAPAARRGDATPMCLSDGHLCVVQPGTGRVLCSGRNLDGQLGDGSGESRDAFVEAPSARGATALACGEGFTCAIVGGEVRCFGRNADGQLGDREVRASTTARVVPGVRDAVEVTAGDDFACARTRDGRVRCWGGASFGAFGPDVREPQAPRVIEGITGATALASGSHHTCAIVAGGEVLCFGDNDGGQLGRPRGAPLGVGKVPGVSRASALALGGDSSCVVIDGRVTCFGGGSHVREVPTSGHDHDHAAHTGEPHDDDAHGARTPTGSPRVIPALAHVRDLAVGHGHACAILEDGTMRCWGDGAFGKLGVGASTASALPTDVLGMIDAVHVVAGRSTTCVQRGERALACFGSNVEGQMGFAELRAHESAVDVARDLRRVIPATSAPAFTSAEPTAPSTPMLDAGDAHACLLGRDGRVRCWGENRQGQLGDGSSVASRVPVEVVGLRNAVEIAVGPSFACARLEDGQVACWGASDGGLGSGRKASSSRPVRVANVTDARGLAAGRRFVCVVHADGGVSCFGAGAYGVLGTGTFESALVPVRIPGLGEVVEVRAGSAFACARKASGRVDCWGSNGEGTLGDGTTEPRSTPAPVVGLADAMSLDAYDTNACAVRRSGRVSCWGDPRNGAIGDDGRARGPVTRPTDVIGLAGAVDVAVGTNSACGRTADGAMLCWGGNLFGQAGVGDEGLRAVVRAAAVLPEAPVEALGPRVDVACGRHGCCALHASLAVSCAGSAPFTAAVDGEADARAFRPRVSVAPAP